MIDTLLDTESLIIHLSCSLRAEAGDGGGNVQFSKIKLNVSCRVHQPAAGEGRRDSSDTLGTEPNL